MLQSEVLIVKRGNPEQVSSQADHSINRDGIEQPSLTHMLAHS